MEPTEEGIEASDLASLLYRFEEAVTPPATPTPIQQAHTTKSVLTVISKDPNSLLSKTPNSCASKTDVTPSQLHVRPRAVYASNKPGITLLPFTLPTHSRPVSSLNQPPNIIIRSSVPSQPQGASQNFAKTAFQLVSPGKAGTSLLIRPNSTVAGINLQHKQGQTATSLISSGQAAVIPVGTTASVTVPLASTSLLQSSKSGEKRSCIIPKKSISISARLNDVKTTASIPVASASASLLPSSLPVSKRTCIIPKRTISISARNNEVETKADSKPQPGVLSTVIPTKYAVSLLTKALGNAGAGYSSYQPKSFQLSQSLPSSPIPFHTNGWNVEEAEHDYCSKVSQTSNNSLSNLNASENLGIISNTVSEKSESKKVIVSDEEIRTISSLDAELIQDLEYLDEHSKSTSVVADEVANENVLEDGEVMVDEDGNDSFPQLVPSLLNQNQVNIVEPSEAELNPGDMPNQSIVAFNLNGEECGPRRGRRYRRRTELNTSPIREDKTDFFDKIPAYYTALSIPKKPIKMSVFATATKSLGSTDHLAPDNIVTEQVDMGLYDKVPAHRRCFTNTTKDLDVNIDQPEEQSQQPVTSISSYPMSSSLLSSSSTELNPESSSPPRRARSRSRRKTRRRHISSCSGSSGPVSCLTSRSRSGSRHSIEQLKSRSRSRSYSRSSRSCSTCSSHSSGSSCGSSCSGCSRSRSRSCSTCSSSGSSRSRSPQEKRDWKVRGERAGASHRRRRHRSDRSSSRRSRSFSPAEKARWRSRSRSQRKHSHSKSSFVDEKVAERRKAREEKKIKDMEERRVVYVGKIPDDYTKRQLHQRFEYFGEIKEVKLNFREHGDNYGFVTFAYACDAIAAKEQGNNIEGAPKFDLCFGGRRLFCPDQYADLDGNREIEEEYAPVPKSMSEELDYAALLKQHSSQQKKSNRF